MTGHDPSNGCHWWLEAARRRKAPSIKAFALQSMHFDPVAMRSIEASLPSSAFRLRRVGWVGWVACNVRRLETEGTPSLARSLVVVACMHGGQGTDPNHTSSGPTVARPWRSWYSIDRLIGFDQPRRPGLMPSPGGPMVMRPPVIHQHPCSFD